MMDIELENQLRSIASGMEYPRTPDIAGSVVRRLHPSTRSRFILRRWAWSLTILLVLLSSLIAIPPVRAAILELIQVGIVRIFPQEVEPTSEVVTSVTPENIIPLDVTPNATSQLLIPFLDQIAGETELVNAQQITSYEIMLPSYPQELGLPDRVYVQDAEGAMTILVWTDSEQPERVTMSLHFIPAGHWAINKFGPVEIQEVEINGQRAIWAVGPYPLFMKDGNIQIERLIDGHVLIWAYGDLTYRLETDLSLDEAIKIAESLKHVP